jgi:hypothetical protein
MTQVARLFGAILVATEGFGESAYFLVGDTKVPCDWAAAGFARPRERDPKTEPYVRLQATGPVRLAAPYLRLTAQGETAARLMADRMLVARNGSVSERLWRLLTGQDDDESDSRAGEHPRSDCIEARWLEEVPASVWNVVRDAVLRCT